MESKKKNNAFKFKVERLIGYFFHRPQHANIGTDDLSTNNGGTQSYGHILFGVIKYKVSFGEMAEWLIAPVLKTGIVLNKELSRVRIPLSPFFAR